MTRGWAGTDAQLLCAGATMCLSVSLAAIHRRTRRDHLLRDVSLFAATLTAVLLATVAIFRFPADGWPVFARATALHAAALVSVRLASSMRGRPAPRWLWASLLACVVLRTALWPTDLIFAHRYDGQGLPLYGPWMSATSVPLVVLTTAYLLLAAFRLGDRLQTLACTVAVSASCVILAVSVFVSDPLIAEPLAAYWTLPQLLALTTISLRRVRHAGLYDSLTGLPNRVLLIRRLETALARPVQHGRTVGVVIADLDGFQRVNDSFGAIAGDALLREIGRRLASSFPDAEVSRAGGDVFAVALRGVPANEVHAAAATFTSVLAGDYECNGNTFGFTASVGVAFATSEDTANSLLRNAETALHRVKQVGGNRVEVYEQRLREQLLDRLRLEHALSRAVDGDEIVLHYQPVVDVEDGSVVGVEALARWRRGEELVAPGEWIPVAEQTGLITGIGAYVMTAACGEAISVGSPLPESAYVAVNVSARQVDDSLLPLVERVLEGCSDPRRLTVEITETAVLQQPELARRLLTTLREWGVRIALDDFGTGHSSLSMLTRLPVDVIKIDRSFISRIVERDGAALVTSIVSLAGSLELSVIAEGVETVDQLELVRDLGCRYAQGYLFARPAPLVQLRPSYAVPGRDGAAGVVLPMQRSNLRRVGGAS